MRKYPFFIGLSFVFGLILPVSAAEDAFFEALSGLCGNKYQAEVVEGNEGDDAWRNSVIIMDVADCSDEVIKIPLSVGEDASRTWIISREEGGLTLKHDHRHEDGTPDEVTMYGGSTNTLKISMGDQIIRLFPADQYSKDLFQAHGLEASVKNTWVLTIVPDAVFSYRLERPGRTFQINFDLTKPIK